MIIEHATIGRGFDLQNAHEAPPNHRSSVIASHAARLNRDDDGQYPLLWPLSVSPVGEIGSGISRSKRDLQKSPFEEGLGNHPAEHARAKNAHLHKSRRFLNAMMESWEIVRPLRIVCFGVLRHARA